MKRCVLIVMGLACAAFAQTGTGVQALIPFDQLVTGLMAKYQVPGGALAITKDGKLVFARGYGFADTDAQAAVQPDSLFRIASLSKLITAVTAMKLVEEGRLDLDAHAFDLLKDLTPAPGAKQDPRLAQITVRELLQHSGGWDRSGAADPMFRSVPEAQAMGADSPASTDTVIRYMLGQPLDFDPGQKFAYSNFGYALLGRIIERAAGMSYEQYVRTHVLGPMGIAGMRIGHTLADGQLPGEVRYYAAQTGPSVFTFGARIVPAPYGCWYLEAMDAHGGWVGSVIDYSKFLNAIDGRRGPRFLSPDSVARMTARPSIPTWSGKSSWYGMGTYVGPAGNDANWWHTGVLDGTVTYTMRSANGLSFVAFFNARPAQSDSFFAELDAGIWKAAGSVSAWPSDDQFVAYPDAKPEQIAATPAITTQDGVLNAASFTRGIVPGSWVSIFGANLAASTRTWSAADFAGDALPTTLDGVRVSMNGKAASVYYVSPNQINAQAPEDLGAGVVRVEVVRNGVGSGAVLAEARDSAPGLFTYLAGGRALAAAVYPDGTLVGGLRSAQPEQRIQLYATGLARSVSGSAIKAAQPVGGVGVTIGGVPAKVEYAGLVGPGLFQINVVVPQVANGDQSISLRAGGVTALATLLPIFQ